MNTVRLPLCISDLICAFAFNTRCKTDIFRDIRWVECVQKSIPSVFLKPYLPASPFFRPWWHESRKPICTFLIERETYADLFTPNPFVKGNPYYPTRALLLEGGFFSNTPFIMCKALRNSVVRKHRKYKGALLNRMRNFTACYSSVGVHPRHMANNLESDWNESLAGEFSYPFWFDPLSYNPSNETEARIIPSWIRALNSATFLASDDHA